MARPTKYKETHPKQASKLCELGATDRDLAEFFEVTVSTISLWKVTHPKFSEALKRNKDKADSNVENALYSRAVGYSHEEDDIRVIEGEVVITPTIKHYPPDTTACIFWLKNRKPEQYRANPEEDGRNGSDKLVDAIGSLIEKLPN